MRAINHALTGALIGFSVHEPLLAVPLGFASHLAQDAIPHFDQPGNEQARLNSPLFDKILLADALACGVLVLIFAVVRPQYWLLAALCAFLATASDLFWFPKYLHNKRTHQLAKPTNWFLRFHSWVQWKTGPRFWMVEAVWFIAVGALVTTKL